MQQSSQIKFSNLPVGKKIGSNLLYNKDFKIPYIIDTISNSPAGHKIPTKSKKNVSIIDINQEEYITENGQLMKSRSIRLNMVN